MGEKILYMYNIERIYPTFSKSDTYLKIDALNNRESLFHCFKHFIPHFLKLPYSFYKALGIYSITFTDQAVIYKPETHPTIMNRLYSGLFPLSALPRREDKKKHFFKTLVYRMKKYYEGFDKDFIEVSPPPKKEK